MRTILIIITTLTLLSGCVRFDRQAELYGTTPERFAVCTDAAKRDGDYGMGWPWHIPACLRRHGW